MLDQVKMGVSSTIGLVLALCIAIAGIGWILRDESPKPGTSVELETPSQAEQKTPEKVDYTPQKPVRILKPKVKKDLGLPDDVQKDDTKKLLATAELNAEKRKYDLSAVMDADGETKIYAKAKPQPWLARSNQTEINFGPMYKSDTELVWELGVRQDFIQSKNVYAFGEARMDSKSDWAVGAKVGARF